MEQSNIFSAALIGKDSTALQGVKFILVSQFFQHVWVRVRVSMDMLWFKFILAVMFF